MSISMTRPLLLWVVTVAGVIVPLRGTGAEQGCSQEAYERADRNVTAMLVRLRNRPQTVGALDMESLFRELGGCGDGYVGESIADVVTDFLVLRWSEFSRLYAIAKHNRAFMQWLMAFVGESARTESLQAIASNALTRCPGKAQQGCAAVLRRAKDALESQGRPLKDIGVYKRQ